MAASSSLVFQRLAIASPRRSTAVIVVDLDRDARREPVAARRDVELDAILEQQRVAQPRRLRGRAAEALGQRHRDHSRPSSAACGIRSPAPRQALAGLEGEVVGCRRAPRPPRTRPGARGRRRREPGRGIARPDEVELGGESWSRPQEMTAGWSAACSSGRTPEKGLSCAAPRPTCGGFRRTSRRRSPAGRGRSRRARGRRRRRSECHAHGSATPPPRPATGACCREVMWSTTARRVRGPSAPSIASITSSGRSVAGEIATSRT